jgi:3-dehydroquinate dehydratase-2
VSTTRKTRRVATSRRPAAKPTPPREVRILVAHGPNLDLLGRRETAIYGKDTLEDIDQHIVTVAPAIALSLGLPVPELFFFQTNHEGELLDRLDGPWDGILLNPAAWTHTSLALADRLAGLGIPYVEVHLSNTTSRESLRHTSLTAPKARGLVMGLGKASYEAGLLGLLRVIAAPSTKKSQ